jgi:hypothetical protein
MRRHPKCPHCGYEFDDEETWYGNYNKTGNVFTGDGDSSELSCPNDDCRKKFECTCVHIIMFESDDDDIDLGKAFYPVAEGGADAE